MVNYLLRRQSPVEAALSRCINASRHLKATQVSIAMRDAAHSESTSRTRRAGGARSTAYPFRPAIDGPGVRAPGGRAVRYPLTRATRGTREVKAVGEAVSFPYRLINNHLLTSATTYGRGGGVGRGLGVGVDLGPGVAVGVTVP